MSLFGTTELNQFEDLLCHELEDLYDAEQRLTSALPKMAEAASSPQLKSAFLDHLRETEGHVDRLERAFRKLGKSPKSHTCEAMKGLIKEGEQIIAAKGDPDVKDAALIAAAQRVEHYEMAGYGSARTFAERLGHTEVADLLQATLDEEGAADHKLTQIAESTINVRAAH